jgi:hypothetical protein
LQWLRFDEAHTVGQIPIWTRAVLGLIVIGSIMAEPKQEAKEEPPPQDNLADDFVA